jgi:uncharacterized membrane protein
MADTRAGRIDAAMQPAPGRPAHSAFFSLAGLTLLLSVVGAGIAAYLTYVHYDESVLVCTAGGGCHTVQESEYATIGPIPIAILGLGMFIVLAGLALVRIFDWTISILDSETANLAAWGITLTALLYYAYLVYVELFVLEAICQWCVATTGITVTIFAVESLGLRRSLAIDDDDLIDE